MLVVGAGPAGASAAYFCAKSNFETILAEKKDFIGNYAIKIDSSPNIGLEKIISKYNLPVKNHVKISKWYAPSGNYFILKSHSGEFYFKRGGRDSYENIVSEKAQEKGAEIITGVQLIGIEEKENIEKIKIIIKNKKEFIVKPKIIIAADGGNSFFHKFVKKEIFRILVGYGISGYDFTSPDCSNIYLNSELLPGGYFYVVSCPDGLSSAGAVINKSKLKGDIKEYFKKFVEYAKVVKLNDRITFFKGFGNIFRINKHFYKNLFFVGDAGGFLDPLLGYGMTPAILSSYLASEAIKIGLESGDISKSASVYEGLINEHLNFEKHYWYREIFENMENRDFEWIIDFLNRTDKKIGISNFIDGVFI
ncbi:NAD(P)-binding protein [Candidatus Pyrohabitans sp.]